MRVFKKEVFNEEYLMCYYVTDDENYISMGFFLSSKLKVVNDKNEVKTFPHAFGHHNNDKSKKWIYNFDMNNEYFL